MGRISPLRLAQEQQDYSRNDRIDSVSIVIFYMSRSLLIFIERDFLKKNAQNLTGGVFVIGYLSILNISLMLFPSRLRYVLYGAVASISLISLSVSAGAADGVFGEYFNNIIRDASSCGTNTAITGFTATAGASFGTQRCTTFQNIVKSVLGTSSATDGQAVV